MSFQKKIGPLSEASATVPAIVVSTSDTAIHTVSDSDSFQLVHLHVTSVAAASSTTVTAKFDGGAGATWQIPAGTANNKLPFTVFLTVPRGVTLTLAGGAACTVTGYVESFG